MSTWHYVREESRCRFIYFMFFERTLHHRMKRELDSELRCKCYKMVNGTRVSATTFNFQKFHFSSKNFQWLEMKNYVHLHCNRNFGKFFQMKNKLHISEYFFTASNKCKLATSAAWIDFKLPHSVFACKPLEKIRLILKNFDLRFQFII